MRVCVMFGLSVIFFEAMLFDTHCHLMDSQFEADLSAVLRRAALERVSDILNLGCDISGSLLSDKMCRNGYREKMVRELGEKGIIAEKVPRLYGSQGIHPHDSNQTNDEVMGEFLNVIRTNSQIVIIGETGLDYFYMNQTREVQLGSLRRHMVLAQETGLPVSIHTRDAADDMLMILKEFPKVRCIMHCFSQDRAYAEEILKMPAGHMISLSGVVTYPKNEELRQVACMVPANRLLIETDAPYLAPQIHRGQRNELMFISETAKSLAQVRGVSFDALAELTMVNAKRFLGISD